MAVFFLSLLVISGLLLLINKASGKQNGSAGPENNTLDSNKGIDVSLALLLESSADFSVNERGQTVSQSEAGIPAALQAVNGKNNQPTVRGYFIEPAVGINWGKLHNYNAVDIANSCGTSVRASADGLVVPDENNQDGENGWNGGYGNFILIEHPNGVRTRYAHLETMLVEAGEFVKQGQKIGTMGATGDVAGITGCHLHFEVIGAKNPFAN